MKFKNIRGYSNGKIKFKNIQDFRRPVRTLGPTDTGFAETNVKEISNDTTTNLEFSGTVNYCRDVLLKISIINYRLHVTVQQ